VSRFAKRAPRHPDRHRSTADPASRSSATRVAATITRAGRRFRFSNAEIRERLAPPTRQPSQPLSSATGADEGARAGGGGALTARRELLRRPAIGTVPGWLIDEQRHSRSRRIPADNLTPRTRR